MNLLTESTSDMISEDKKAFHIEWPPFSGINPLVTAAIPLLLMMIHIKELSHPPEPSSLRTRAIQEINEFEEQAKSLGCMPRTILAARYCLCTAVDEFALATSWASNGLWAQHTLLSIIHKETWGGERFFIILEKMAEDDKKNIDFLELLYLILSLGYEGKYYVHDRMIREEIRHRLFRLIQMRRGIETPPLSLMHHESILSTTESKSSFKLWAFPILTLGILSLLWLGFNYQTYQQANPALETLKNTTLS